MIIFGLRQVVKNIFIYSFQCDHCRRTVAHALRRAVTSLTFFFIPLLPVRTRYSSQCTYCGATRNLDGRQATKLRTATQRDADYIPTFR